MRPVATTVTVNPTVALLVTRLVRMGTVTEVEPAGTTAEATVDQAMLGESLAMFTVVPPAGAGRVSRMVQVELAPPETMFGLNVTLATEAATIRISALAELLDPLTVIVASTSV